MVDLVVINLNDAIEYNVFGEEFYFGDSGDNLDGIDRPPVQLSLAPYWFEPVKRDRQQSESVDQPGTSSASAVPDFPRDF